MTSFANAFEPRSARRPHSARTWRSPRPQCIGDTEHEWHLGTDHHQVDVELRRQRDDGLAGGRVDGVVGRDRLGAGIAGRENSSGDRWVGGEAEGRACSRPPER